MISLIISCLLLTPFTLDRVVAIVGDEPILFSDVQTLLVETGYSVSGNFDEDITTRQFLAALEELIEEEMLVEAARITGMYPSELEVQGLVDEEIERILESNTGEGPYLEYLASIGIDPADVPPDQSEAILAYLGSEEFLMNYVASAGMTVQEYRSILGDFLGDRQAAQAYVGSKIQMAMREAPINPMAFLATSAELVEEIVMPRHLAWIYFPVLPSGADLDLALSEIVLLRSRIEGGESFETLAMEWSQDGSASQGGSLGSFGPGQMVAIFERALDKLEIGEISPPVITSFGVHLIRLDDRLEDGTVSASHILRLVPLEIEDVNATVDQAASVRDDILTRGSISFEEAAILLSMDLDSAPQGGDLGTVPMSFWPASLADPASELEPGDVSEPVVLPDAGAVVLIKRYDDQGEMDWSMYTEDELDGIVQQVIYQEAYSSLVDSLAGEIPVIHNI